MSDQPTTTPPITTPATQKKLGMFDDPAGDFSSKRFESIIAFFMAMLISAASFVLAACGIDPTLGGKFPLTWLVGTILAYSAACQGIAWGTESNLFPQGQNTSGGLLGSVISKITGGGTPPAASGGN